MKTLFCTIRSATLGLLATALFTAPSSFAALTNYGTFVGSTVTYWSVSEFSITDPLPLFGAPTVTGNTLDFNPTFSAFASGAGGVDQTDGQLNLWIKANSGNAIPTVMFSEQGDFSMTGIGGTANTLVAVSATFFIDIYKVDGVSLPSPLNVTASMTFAPNASGVFDKPTYPSPPTRFWSGSFNFDVNNALTVAGISYVSGATEISVALDNILYAQSEAGTTARISKKDFKGLGITVPVVPEPSILALTLCGAGLLFARRRSLR